MVDRSSSVTKPVSAVRVLRTPSGITTYQIGPANDLDSITKNNIHLPNYWAVSRLGYFLQPQAYDYTRRYVQQPIGSSTRTEVKLGNVFVSEERVSGRTSYHGWLSNPMNISSDVDMRNDLSAEEISQTDFQATNRLYANLRSQKVNLALVWAEKKKTEKLILDNLKRIYKMIMDVKKGHFGALASQLFEKTPNQLRRYAARQKKSFRKRAAQAVLEVQYGVRPLLNDVYGACEELNNLDRNLRSVSAQGSATNRWATSTNTSYVSDTIPGTMFMGRNGNYSVKYTVYFRVDYPTWSDLGAVGITNPAYLAYELIPFSFVLDWFWPVGSWIANLDTTMGMTFLGGSKTTFVRNNVRRIASVNYATSTVSYVGASYMNREYVRMVRTTLQSFPNLPIPPFKNPLSPEHVLNGISLLTALFKKR